MASYKVYSVGWREQTAAERRENPTQTRVRVLTLIGEEDDLEMAKYLAGCHHSDGTTLTWEFKQYAFEHVASSSRATDPFCTLQQRFVIRSALFFPEEN